MNINMLLGGCCESRNGGSCCDDRETLRKRGNGDVKVQNLSAQNCGVGVLFSINEKGELTVAALVPGSPAEQSTLVRVGDVLHLVDDQDVWCKSPQEVHRLVMGKEGTSVKLSFKMDGCHGLVHVQLQRRSVGAAERRKVVSQVAALRELSNARKGYASVPVLSDITNDCSAASNGGIKPIQGGTITTSTSNRNPAPAEIV